MKMKIKVTVKLDVLNGDGVDNDGDDGDDCVVQEENVVEEMEKENVEEVVMESAEMREEAGMKTDIDALGVLEWRAFPLRNANGNRFINAQNI